MKHWTNPSVVRFAEGGDPVDLMRIRAKEVVLRAMEGGWSGPPFDPIALASLLEIEVRPSMDVPDARVLWEQNRYVVEYNPTKPAARAKFSIAHEIGHTLFTDCHELIRNRVEMRAAPDDEWQLEMLCNVAAAEFLMPAGALHVDTREASIRDILDMQKEFAVSTEAVLLRRVKTTTERIAAFAASRIIDEKGAVRHNIDYVIASGSFGPVVLPRTGIESTAMADCNAVGVKSQGKEQWGEGAPELWVECVALPAYPGQLFPRVVGFVRQLAGASAESTPNDGITYVDGDALHLKPAGPLILAFVVNDQAKRWGGGFAAEVRRRWPDVQEDFVSNGSLELGDVRVAHAEDEVWTAAMVAQHGYKQMRRPGIRYRALDDALAKLAEAATERGATVHMPRIGTGQAGGNWEVIRDLLIENLVDRGIGVTVYQNPSARTAVGQMALGLAAR